MVNFFYGLAALGFAAFLCVIIALIADCVRSINNIADILMDFAPLPDAQSIDYDAGQTDAEYFESRVLKEESDADYYLLNNATRFLRGLPLLTEAEAYQRIEREKVRLAAIEGELPTLKALPPGEVRVDLRDSGGKRVTLQIPHIPRIPADVTTKLLEESDAPDWRRFA